MSEHNAHAERGRVLLQQGRADLALPELQKALGLDPDDGFLHLTLAQCLDMLDREREALASAEQAVAKLPDFAVAHLVRGRCLMALNKHAAARVSFEEARRLDPEDVDVFAALAALHADLRDWPAARDCAEQGLRLDPEHSQCSNLRAFALTQMGQGHLAEKEATAELNRDPENAWSHAQHGWALLNQARYRDAALSFREALRLEPGLEFARNGMIEALKARNPIYALFLRYFLFMGRLGSKAWIIIIGLWFLQGQLRQLSVNFPDYAWLFQTLYWTLFAFAIGTWVVSPLFNFTLWLHPLGRLALSDPEKRQAMVLAGCLLGLAVTITVAITGVLPMWSPTVALAAVTLPVVMAWDDGLKRLARGMVLAGAVVLAALSVPWIKADHDLMWARKNYAAAVSAAHLTAEHIDRIQRAAIIRSLSQFQSEAGQLESATSATSATVSSAGSVAASTASATAGSFIGSRSKPPETQPEGRPVSRSQHSKIELAQIMAADLPAPVRDSFVATIGASEAMAKARTVFMTAFAVIMLGTMFLANGFGRK